MRIEIARNGSSWLDPEGLGGDEIIPVHAGGYQSVIRVSMVLYSTVPGTGAVQQGQSRIRVIKPIAAPQRTVDALGHARLGFIRKCGSSWVLAAD